MKNLANEIRTAIENNGGLTSFSSQIRKNRPVGCPMKRMMINELQELSKEELHVAFHLGLIGNKNMKGSIVENATNLGFVASQKRDIAPGNEYDNLFSIASFEDPIRHKSMEVRKTLELMAEIVQRDKKQTKKLANKLYDSNKSKFAKNIWDFVYNHIQYELDESGIEQLRTPRRTWADRFEGVDCDCMSIFISSILTNKNIPHFFRITKYGRPNWQHVYVVVPDGDDEIIIDTVMDSFNSEKEYSVKKDFNPQTGKELRGLGELNNNDNQTNSTMLNSLKSNPVTAAAIGVIAVTVGYVTYDALKKPAKKKGSKSKSKSNNKKLK